MSFASFLLREVVIYCFVFFFQNLISEHTRRRAFCLPPISCLCQSRRGHVWIRQHNELQPQHPHSFISFPSPSRRQRNCCQQVTHSIKHPIPGYKQNTSYSLIAQAELCASQCCFFPHQAGEGAHKQKVSPRLFLVCLLYIHE